VLITEKTKWAEKKNTSNSFRKEEYKQEGTGGSRMGV
jgi:hypothetical protein